MEDGKTAGVEFTDVTDVTDDKDAPVKQASKKSAGASRAAEDDIVVPTRFERFLFERACLSFWLLLGSSLFFCMMAGAMFSGGVLEMSTTSVWDVLGDINVQRFQALREAKDESKDTDLSSGVMLERVDGDESVVITYEVKDGNVFDNAILEKIQKFEQKLVDASEWPGHCQLIYDANGANPRCTGGNSMLSFWKPDAAAQRADLDAGYGPCGGDQAAADTCDSSPYQIGRKPCVSNVYNPLTQNPKPSISENFTNTLRCLCCAAAGEGCDDLDCQNTEDVLCGTSIVAARRQFRNKHIGKEFSCSTGVAKLARSIYHIGYPIKGYDNTDNDDEVEDMEEEVRKWTAKGLYEELTELREELSDDDFQIYFWGAGSDDDFFTQRLMMDQMLAVGSFFVVFVWIWVGTGSCFLAICGMIEITLSIPLAMFVWGVFQGKFVTFFMLTVLFLILGIGADDIFVLWDAVKQAPAHFRDRSDNSGVVRFAWSLRRARCAMSVTSATTFFGLMACGISSIPSLSAFGLFGALVVLFDFILVITFFPCATVIYDRYFAKVWGLCRPINRCMAKCTGAGGAEGAEEEELRSAEKFFRDKWSPWLQRARLPVFAFWCVLGVVAIAVPAAGLRPASEAPGFFNDEYGKRYGDLLTGDGFNKANDGAKVVLEVVIGIDPEEPIDRAGTNYQDDENVGVPVYNDAGIKTLRESSGQLRLWNMCEDARSGSFNRVALDADCNTTVSASGVRLESQACQTGAVCFIDWVRDYRIKYRSRTESDWHEDEDLETTLASAAFRAGGSTSGHVAPFTNAQCGDCCNVFGWYYCLMYQERTEAGLQNFNDWRKMSAYYFNGDKLKWVYVTMNTTLDNEGMALGDIIPHYDDWTEWVDERLGNIEGFQTCGMWMWMVTQQEILKSVFQSILYCLILAFLILCLATTNWIISVISLSCILLILFIFAMMITAFGWDLGIFEAVGLIVVIGLSVDYSVHISHAYNETRFIDGKSASREARTTHALTEMGISVVSGASTTLLASLFLLPAGFTFYHVFGIFMLVTVIGSVLVSLSLLPAMLMIFGPEGDRGDLLLFRRVFGAVAGKCGLCCGRNSTKVGPE